MVSLPASSAELLLLLEDYTPTVPDELTQHFMQRTGTDCQDRRLVRLISLASQHFIANVLCETKQICRLRRMAMKKPSKSKDAKEPVSKMVISTEALSQALTEFGVNVRSPPYFVDVPVVDGGARP